MAASEPVASDHLAEDRWPARGTQAEDAHDAWLRALPLDLPTGTTSGAYPRLPQHDEARIDPQTKTVIFRRGETLVTCYDLSVVDTFHGHAARAAATEQYPELIHDE